MLASVMSTPPEISEALCLNERASSSQPATGVCTRCRDICPPQAIQLQADIPQLDAATCTGCMACTATCPVSAVSHETVDPRAIVREAHALTQRGSSRLYAICSAVSDDRADLRVPCHGLWDALLLAAIAAEGIRDIHIVGTDQCTSCPVRHGADIFTQTKRDYDTLNMALEMRLEIHHDAPPAPKPEPYEEETPDLREPSRRAFFRNLVPAIAQGVAMSAAQVGQAARQELAEERQETSDDTLPVRHQLFVKALPRLKPVFTPIPDLPSLPIGAIQASDACTACGTCVEVCPTQALALNPFGANTVLEFRPDACIGCKHCVTACPEHAIEALPGISLPAIATGRSRPLIMVATQKDAQTSRQQQPIS